MMPTKVQKATKISTIEQLDQRQPEKREPAKQLLSFLLKDDITKFVQIRAFLPEKERSQLLEFIWWNEGLFAWSTLNMPGILLEVITYKLNIDPNYKPVR